MDTAITLSDQSIGKAESLHYKISNSVSYEKWVQLGEMFHTLHRNINWRIGDWLLFGEGRFPDRYSQATHLTGRSDVTMRNCAWVASVYPPEERVYDLSFTHYLEVAGVKETKERHWLLAKAEQEDMSALALRAFRSGEVRQKPMLPEPEFKDHIPENLQIAIEGFTSQLMKCPLSATNKEADIAINFPWGKLEMKFVRTPSDQEC